MSTLKFLGHACFLLENENHTLIFDPFLADNPWKIAMPEDISCTHVLVSHAHGDHLGEAAQIAKKNNATVIATAEIAGLLQNEGCQAHAMHIGGRHAFDFGSVKITPAFHGSGVPGGHACGFLVDFAGITVYFAGDTSLFGDMALLGRLEKIDYALLPIGDNYTMGPDDAVEAAVMLGAKTIIPMHYNTWPLLAQDPDLYKGKVEQRTSSKVHILKPGEALTL